MDIYVLDEDFKRVDVVDSYESFIWTERFQTHGDFELVFPDDSTIRSTLTAGTWISINESYRIMQIETLEPTTDDEGRSLIKFTGRSLEAILMDRVAKNGVPDALGTPNVVMTVIFLRICVEGRLTPGDTYPQLEGPGGGPVPDPIGIGDLPFPTDTIHKASADMTTVYDALVEVAEAYDIGWRLILNPEYNRWVFTIDPGSNRTTQQRVHTPVIFSPDFDTLTNISEVYSIKDLKNVAAVYSDGGAMYVYADGLDIYSGAVDGLNRRVLLVDAGAVPDGMTAKAYMTQKGKEALAEHRRIQAMDGEVPKNSVYTYGVDYQLGDLVELRNRDGVTNIMRVMEQIFVSDSEGVRSYPTLVTNQFITPGSWLDWKYNTFWINAEGEWATQ